jgi:SNF family Na+-dependent transporter
MAGSVRAIINNVKREPVRWFAAIDGLVALLSTGLIVFDAWHPTLDQLAFVTGATAVVASALGFTIVRQAVTPNEKLSDAVVDRAAHR